MINLHNFFTSYPNIFCNILTSDIIARFCANISWNNYRKLVNI